MKSRWLFVCSCIALITSAFTFVVRGDVLQQLGNAFEFNQAQRGGIEGAVFLGMAISMFVGGFICDALGMKKIMWLAFASHLIGSVGTIIAPHNEMSYYWLYATSLLMGFGNGFTEVAINPLVATLYPNQKTHYLNILHAWWPGGLVIGGILARLVGGGLQLTGEQPTIPGMGFNWQISLGLIVLPALIYGFMLIPAVFPHTERVASGVSTGDMFKEVLRPMFLLWAFCMLLTAATELGPQKWQESVISSTTKGAVSGTLILVYTSGMMFVLRHFAGPIAHKLSPTGMLIGSSILAGTGLYLLSFANSPATAFGYATIFGLGIAYFWPTMLGVSAERFPKGGALILALMGTAGNISISYVLPQMGKIADHYSVSYVEKNDSSLVSSLIKGSGSAKALNEDEIKKLQAEEKSTGQKPEALKVAESAQREGFSWAFRWVSLLPVVLVVLFGGIFLYDKARGGYKPEVLMSREEENELFAGGVQAEVH
jgi:MFS family permease